MSMMDNIDPLDNIDVMNGAANDMVDDTYHPFKENVSMQ